MKPTSELKGTSISKRFFQFRLRTILLVLLLVALGTAWYGNYVRHQQQQVRHQQLQKKLIQSIGERGGYVWLDKVGPRLDIDFMPPVPGRSCGQVQCIADGQVPPSQFGDADIELFERLTNLRSVDFTGTSVTSAAITKFCARNPKIKVKP